MPHSHYSSLIHSLILFASVAQATTYTVKAAGGGDYTTIQSCATAISAGDTCTVFVGTYNEDVTLTAGTVGNLKTLQVNGSDAVVARSFSVNSYNAIIGFTIEDPSAPTSASCVTINDGSSYVYITNNAMSQCGNGTGGYIIWTGNGTGADHVYVQGNTFSYGCGTPASPDACSGISTFGNHFLIENNDFSHVLLAVNVHSSYTVIRNNVFHDMNQSECASAPGCHMDLIFAQPPSTHPASYNLWEKNVARDNTGSDTKGFLTQANICDGNCTNVIIRFNDIAHLDGGVISNENSGDGGVPGFTHVKSYNNTWVDVNSYAPTNQITNNTGNNSTYGANINDLFYYPFTLTNFNPYATDASTIATFVARNNLAYCTGSPCNMHGSVYGSGSFTDDTGNIVSDPLFSNYALDNFALTSTSPARDAGGHLTTVAVADGGSGTTLVVDDAAYFQDGYGLVDGDCIAVGTVGNTACIASINYDTNTVTLASAITRSDGENVWLYKNSSGVQVLYGTDPDIGAYEYIPPVYNQTHTGGVHAGGRQ